jgi:hypothetical protein
MKTKQILRDTIILIVSIVWFSFVGMLLGGCQRPSIQSTHTKEVIKKDSLIYLSGANVEKVILIDSLAHLEPGRWYEHWDSLHNAQISYMRDKLNRLQMKATCPPDCVRVVVTHTIEKQHTTETIEKKVTPRWVWVVLGISISMFALGFILTLVRR